MLFTGAHSPETLDSAVWVAHFPVALCPLTRGCEEAEVMSLNGHSFTAPSKPAFP
jgi:hypothetical protein